MRRDTRPTTDWDWTALRTVAHHETRRLITDAHDRDEVVQEAMIRAFRQRHRCRQAHHPIPWIRRIARMEALRALDRQRARRMRETPPDVLDHLPGHDAPMEQIAEHLDVRAAVASMPAQDRALLEARYAHDMTQTDVATLLRMPEGTVKVRLHRARHRLRSALAES